MPETTQRRNHVNNANHVNNVNGRENGREKEKEKEKEKESDHLNIRELKEMNRTLTFPAIPECASRS